MKTHQDESVQQVHNIYCKIKEYEQDTLRNGRDDLVMYSALMTMYDECYSEPDHPLWLLSPYEILTVIHETEHDFIDREFPVEELNLYAWGQGFIKFKKNCTPEELSEYNDNYGISEAVDEN